MRRLARAVFVLAIGAMVIWPGAASAVPMGWFQVGGGQVHYIDSWQAFDAEDTFVSSFHVEVDGLEIQGDILAKFDPFISYGISVQNLTDSPVDFAFHFETPIMAIEGPNTVFASLSSSATDPGGDGVTVTPTQADMDGDGVDELAVATLNGTNMGVDVGEAYGHGPGEPGGSYVFGPWESGPMAGPIAGEAWDQMAVDLEFNLSPDFDVTTINGYASIEVAPIPEPSALLLLGGGLLGVAYWRRRRS